MSRIVRRLVGDGFILVVHFIDDLYPRLVVSLWSPLFILTELSSDYCVLWIVEEIPYAEEGKAAEAAVGRDETRCLFSDVCIKCVEL